MGRVKLKKSQGKGISVEKFNALGQKVRKFMNSLKGMKFADFRGEGRPSTAGSAARKRMRDANKGKDAGEKAPTTKDKITYASAAKKERQIVAELLALKKNSELTSAQRKQLEVLQSRVDGVAARAFDKANVRGAITKTKMKGYDPSKNVPVTKDVDVKAEKKKELKEDRERVEKVREIMARDKKAKGGMTMKKKGMAIGGAMMKKKGMAKGGAMMKKKGMARGGMKKKGYAMGGMRVKYKVGGMVKGKKYGMVDNKKKK